MHRKVWMLGLELESLRRQSEYLKLRLWGMPPFIRETQALLSKLTLPGVAEYRGFQQLLRTSAALCQHTTMYLQIRQRLIRATVNS